ncbi:SRR1-like protein isoform X1 [Pectinophora gossypiella]|nr:SRR1-like protein isoform X1 [Pectinophora gossypiella]
MSKMSKFDSDGFQIVTSKRFSKNKPTKIPAKEALIEKEETLIDIEKAISRINSAVDDLKVSNYLKEVSVSVSTLVQSKKVAEIVCFGLGHIGECQISRHQLAYLLCLKDICGTSKVLAHDPIFYKSECDILKRLNIEVIDENKEGDYIISDKEITIVYLPHCPKQLTNNFLWSNWGVKLQNCILICNSFTSLIENHPSRITLKTVPYIYNIYPHCTEIPLKNNFKFTDIFNDTAIHYFPEDKLEKLNSEFWIKGDKPQYENSEEFITSLMIEKLNI